MSIWIILYVICIPIAMFLMALDFKCDKRIGNVDVADLIMFFLFSAIGIGIGVAFCITAARFIGDFFRWIDKKDFLKKVVW